MADEFNDFSKDVERQKNEVKSWARLKMELSGLKTDRDFAQAVNREMIKFEQENQNKSETIKNLENEFSVSSDRVQDIANEVSKDYLRKDSHTSLKNLLNYLVTIGEDLYILAQKYTEIIGNEVFVHPNYEKFIEYSNFVLQELNDEISLRQEMGMED